MNSISHHDEIIYYVYMFLVKHTIDLFAFLITAFYKSGVS